MKWLTHRQPTALAAIDTNSCTMVDLLRNLLAKLITDLNIGPTELRAMAYLGLVQKQLRTFHWENMGKNADLILNSYLWLASATDNLQGKERYIAKALDFS